MMWTALAWIAGLGGCGPGVELASPSGPEPRAQVMRRLNRSQYDNTVRDLLGTETALSSSFPLDERANGFDNQGEVLTTSAAHVEAWEMAAGRLATEALRAPLRESWVVCGPEDPGGAEACFELLLRDFTARAWRRPPTPEQLDPLLALALEVYATDGSFDLGLELAVKAALLSPRLRHAYLCGQVQNVPHKRLLSACRPL